MQFVKATKKRSHARVALVGPPGSGKTYSAMSIMRGLLPAGARLAVIDTERGSASKYSHLFEFDVLELPSFEPDTYVKALYAAADAGYDGVIVDSLSHAWVGKGGALEQVDKRSGGGASSFTSGWRDVTPMQNRMVEALLTFPGHVITTMRVKTEYVLEETVKKGVRTSVPRKVGMAPVQRDGLEYEFDVVGDLNHENTLSITKTRCPPLNGAIIEQPGEEMGATLLAWLTDGTEMAPPAKRPTLPGAPQKLPLTPPTRPAEPAKAVEPAPAAPPFDPALATRLMEDATTEAQLNEAIKGSNTAAQDVRDELNVIFFQRRIAIRKATATAAAAAAAPPVETASPATADAAPAAAVTSPVQSPANDTADASATPVDPGWDAGLAALAQVVGFSTAGWSPDDLLEEWHRQLDGQSDRKEMPVALGPWLAALKSKQDASLLLRHVVIKMAAAFNDRMKELREAGAGQPVAAGGAA